MSRLTSRPTPGGSSSRRSHDRTSARDGCLLERGDVGGNPDRGHAQRRAIGDVGGPLVKRAEVRGLEAEGHRPPQAAEVDVSSHTLRCTRRPSSLQDGCVRRSGPAAKTAPTGSASLSGPRLRSRTRDPAPRRPARPGRPRQERRNGACSAVCVRGPGTGLRGRIVLQVFFIGLGLFADPENLVLHHDFGWILHVAPLLVL